MKVLCDVCERAAAAVVCCADEAALCWNCDEKVHAANKLAEKHQRVPLLFASSNSDLSSSNSSFRIPTCDICQEKPGYFFCLEDPALLCRQCDVGIHTASPYVSSHQRLLIAGVRVALEHHNTIFPATLTRTAAAAMATTQVATVTATASRVHQWSRPQPIPVPTRSFWRPHQGMHWWRVQGHNGHGMNFSTTLNSMLTVFQSLVPQLETG